MASRLVDAGHAVAPRNGTDLEAEALRDRGAALAVLPTGVTDPSTSG